MNKIFNQAWKYFAGGATILAYEAWIDQMKSSKRAFELKNEINSNSNFESVKNQISKLQEEFSSSLDSETKNELNDKINELTNQLISMKGVHNSYFDKFVKGNVSSDPEASVCFHEKYKTQIDEAFNKVNNKAKEISDILNNTKDKFMGNNSIFDVINDFREYLASLSAMEICLIINITTSVFILTCIISIFLASSGNYLIDKFSLEKNLPKLRKIIQLRVKFQRYYIFINSAFIVLAILSLIFVNTITLING